ncbi:MAG TPA: 30S ribosomal protein S8 [Patescibacteria group bacterium]|nr:30S ribosomal protein S8 [Patescibacteria group bacterium]
MLDPIADMLTRIRNAQVAGHTTVVVRASKLKHTIAKILSREGFLGEVTKEVDGTHEILRMGLKYTTLSPTKKAPAIQDITRVSKQGRRVYVKKSDIRKVKNGYGVSIVSTSQGIMTGGEAYKRGLGGEYICRLW